MSLTAILMRKRNFLEGDTEFAGGTAHFIKMEVHAGIYWYSTDPRITANMTAVPVARVREIIRLNRKGIKP